MAWCKVFNPINASPPCRPLPHPSSRRAHARTPRRGFRANGPCPPPRHLGPTHHGRPGSCRERNHPRHVRTWQNLPPSLRSGSFPARPLVHRPADCPKTVTAPSTPRSRRPRHARPNPGGARPPRDSSRTICAAARPNPSGGRAGGAGRNARSISPDDTFEPGKALQIKAFGPSGAGSEAAVRPPPRAGGARRPAVPSARRTWRRSRAAPAAPARGR